MKRNAGFILLLIIIGIIVIAVTSAGASLKPLSSSSVAPNVTAGNIDLGGLNREQGIKKLREYSRQLNKQCVFLTYEDLVRELSLDEIGIELDEGMVMEQALKIGHKGPAWERWREMRRAREKGIQILLVIYLDRDKLCNRVDMLFSDIIRTPVDASFKIADNNQISIIPGQNGLVIDYDTLYKDLIKILSTGHEPYSLRVPLEDAPPSRTVEDLESMGLNGLLSAYTTWFDPSQVDRTYNIRVAAAALDELLVPPGKEVSFNKVVGPRSTEAGYKRATVIVDNEFVDGIGGGVCQVSTTIYNAVLLADLEVTCRSNHSIPVSYIPLGRDAAVAYDYLDFCFVNNSNSYILIKSSLGYDNVTFKIFGNTEYKKDVSIKTWVTEVLEPAKIYEENEDLPIGEEVIKQEGRQGFKTSGRLEITYNGESYTRPLLSSFYRSKDKIIVIGTKEVTGTIDIPPDVLIEDDSDELDDAANDKPPAGDTGNGNVGNGNEKVDQLDDPEPVVDITIPDNVVN